MLHLPPDPKLRFDSEIFTLINEAEKLLNQLEGSVNLLSDDHFIIPQLSLLEALNSTRIDNLKLSEKDLFLQFIKERTLEQRKLNRYMSAFSLGKKLLKDVSNSSHIIKSIHKELSKEESGNTGSISEFRSTEKGFDKNSINPVDSKFNFPSPEEIPNLMNELQSYIVSNISYPVLINAALIHAQFELIHPFENGNGLVGRILFHLYMQFKKRAGPPVLQISRELHKRRTEYFGRLADLERNNNWETWIKFFLRIVIDAEVHTLSTIKNISHLERKHYLDILRKEFASTLSLRLFNLLFQQPIISLSYVTKKLIINKQTANVIIAKFLEENILVEITGQQRNRLFAYKNYLDLLSA